MQEAASPEPPTKLGEFQASPEPSLAELEGDFFLTATETLGKTDTVALLAQAGRQSEAGEINLTMARLAKKRAESRIEECENSEQESRWRRLLETANAYLDKASRSTGLQANALEDTFEGYRLAPEKQAELMAQSHQTMLEVSEIYSKMAAERTESMAKINAIHQEAALFISKTHRKCAEARATSNDKQFQEWLRILSGRDST